MRHHREGTATIVFFIATVTGWLLCWGEQAPTSQTVGTQVAAVTSTQPLNQPSLYVNSIGMEFVLIPSGSFLMGGEPSYGAIQEDETPQHRVSISLQFYLGKYEVTQEQWAAIMGSNPSRFRAPTNPVEQVSWDDVQEFIRRLSAREVKPAYRLPTEAEWEYGCRAGSTGRFSFGNDEWRSKDYAWCYRNSESTARRVGILSSNAWGLFDMHGNVWEWCQDWHGRSYYSQAPESDPHGPTRGTRRVMRGGAWTSPVENCRSSIRYVGVPGDRSPDVGFRLVRPIQ